MVTGNAVAHALGGRACDMPFARERNMAALLAKIVSLVRPDLPAQSQARFGIVCCSSR